MDLELRFLLDHLFDHLDRTDYYKLLGVAKTADPEEIRVAFYARADVMHPDRHFHLVDSDLREKIDTVYKRVAEAYRVLGGPATRVDYDSQLQRGIVRYQPETQRDVLKDPELSIRNFRARRLFLDAKAALQAGNPQGAALVLKLADSLEPDNPVIQAAMAEATSHGGLHRGNEGGIP